jgi:release factor H-coupled RctB family protein
MHGAGESLGTAGGGNHFLELGQVEHVRDRERSTSVGLVPGGLAVLAHTGSRSVGHHLADGWPEGPLRDGERDRWMGDLAGALRFAATNRLLLGWKMVRAVGGGRPGNVAGLLDIIHNTVVADDRGFLHRKGCAPAELDQLTVVLGSRGTHSHVMVGLGCEAGLCSVAHGAGRKMTRSEATQKIKSRYSRASLSRTALGSRVVCDDTALLYEEHPDAYKAIDPVISALEQHGAARRVAALRPLVTVKR